jgi:hypothetical protein
MLNYLAIPTVIDLPGSAFQGCGEGKTANIHPDSANLINYRLEILATCVGKLRHYSDNSIKYCRRGERSLIPGICVNLTPEPGLRPYLHTHSLAVFELPPTGHSELTTHRTPSVVQYGRLLFKSHSTALRHLQN